MIKRTLHYGLHFDWSKILFCHSKIKFTSSRHRVIPSLYILEALRHNYMPGLLPGWTRKDTEQLPNFFWLRVKMLNVLYILEALRHNYMPGLLPGWTTEDIEQCLIFFRLPVEVNVLCIPEALRHNYMPGLLPGWTRKDIEHLPNIFFGYGS